MNILQIVDVPDWAIGHLAKIPVRHLPHLKFKTLYVHPKEVTDDKVQIVRDNLQWADIVDLQYWNTARQLLQAIPELAQKKLMLTHHNQRDLLAFDWKDINLHIVHTRKAEDVLRSDGGYQNVMQIPYGFDLSFFKYNQTLTEEKVVGYCGRITSWKGLKDIARACYELGYPLLMMGKMDKRGYWDEIPAEHKAIMDFSFMEAPDDQRTDFYKGVRLYVGYSGPDHEEGTMPLQEAMACGVPVLTTPAGVAEDIIEDHRNGLITPFGDYEALKENIKEAMDDSKLLEELRRNAWNTIKLHTEERMAWEFEAAYHSVFSIRPLVSVIIPAYNNTENVAKILLALESSKYQHFEVVVCDDGYRSSGLYGTTVRWRELRNFPIKYVRTRSDSGKYYGLAEARNRGVMEAHGEYLMFCDSRLEPDPDAIYNFMEKIEPIKKDKVWLFGEKGFKKDSFVENFSFIRRDYFIRAGMMNERIDHYGGMSQELRTRFKWLGFEPIYVPEAKCKQISGSHLTDERRQEIIKAKLLLWKMGMKG